MRKYLIILPIVMFILGCGRVGTESYRVHVSGETVSKKGDFDIIRKSQFMQSSNSYVKQGHYSLLFKYTGTEPLDREGILYENGSKYSSSESGEAEVVIDSSKNSITNNILLLLDFSGSIIKDRALREQLKESVTSFIDKVSYKKKVKIAIYYFNAKERITPIVSDPLEDGGRLKDEISRLDDSYFERIIEENLISTNLYGGVVEATQIACRWVGNCTSETISSTPTFDKDNFEFASVVVFTDGRDTARWTNESTMFSTIKKNKALFYQGVGVGDADEKLIDEISTDSGIYEKKLDTNAIESVFDDLTSWANSFYEASYCPAAQNGTVDIEIDALSDNEPIGTIKDKKVKLHSNEGFRCDLFN